MYGHQLQTCSCIFCLSWRRVAALVLEPGQPDFLRDEGLRRVRQLHSDLLDFAEAGLPPLPALSGRGFAPTGPGGLAGLVGSTPVSGRREEGQARKEAAGLPAEAEPTTEGQVKGSASKAKEKEKRKEKKEKGKEKRKKSEKAAERGEAEDINVKGGEAEEAPESREIEKVKEEKSPTATTPEWGSGEAQEEEPIRAKSVQPERRLETPEKKSEESPPQAASSHRRRPSGSASRSPRRTLRLAEVKTPESGREKKRRPSPSRKPREPDHPPPQHRRQGTDRPPGRFDPPTWGYNNWYWEGWNQKGSKKRDRAKDIQEYGLDADRKWERKQRGRW